MTDAKFEIIKKRLESFKDTIHVKRTPEGATIHTEEVIGSLVVALGHLIALEDLIIKIKRSGTGMVINFSM